MVIKLYKIQDEFCVKISDELTKNTGNPEAVKKIKEQFGLETNWPFDLSGITLKETNVSTFTGACE